MKGFRQYCKQFLPRDAMLARCMLLSCVCPSVRLYVCLFVCLLHAGKVTVKCMLPITLGDPPQTTPFSTFCVAVRIFVVGELRDFKFVGQADHSKSQPVPERGVVMHVT